MESQPTPIEKDLSLPPLPDSCPISSLLGNRLTTMTDEELDAHLKKVRAARESPQILRALLTAGTRKEKSVKKEKKPDLNLLGL